MATKFGVIVPQGWRMDLVGIADGFGSFASAARFCRAFDELRQHFRYRSTTRETMPLAQQRQIFRERLAALQELMGAVA